MDDFTPDPIEEGLWLGRAPRTPEEYALLRDLGVSDVLTLQTEEEARSIGVRPDISFRLALHHGLREHRLPIEDLSPRDLASEGPRAVLRLMELRARGRSVYVHCAAGLHRSPTIVAAYLAVQRGLGGPEACERVRQAHPSQPDEAVVASIVRELRGRAQSP